MTTMRHAVLTTALAILLSAAAVLAAPVVADVQVVAVDASTWILRLRSSEAQAFDVVAEGTPFVVRLHGAAVSPNAAPVATPPFGSVAVTSRDGAVEVSVAAEGAQITAAQGRSAEVVEIRVTRRD